MFCGPLLLNITHVICVTFTIGQILSFVHYFLREFPHVISAVKCKHEGLHDWFLFIIFDFFFPHPPIMQSSLSLVLLPYGQNIRQVHFGSEQLMVGLNPLCCMSAIPKNAIFNRVLWRRQKDVCTIAAALTGVSTLSWPRVTRQWGRTEAWF